MSHDLTLVLVRHGETEWTEQGLLHGRLDSPLSQRGREHASLAAGRLQGDAFDALYSSPRGRALETAAILGEALGLEPRPLEGLEEMNYGWLEGKPLSLVDPDLTGARFFRGAVRLLMRWTGEGPQQLARRVAAALESVQQQHPQGRLLLVTHWGVLSMMLASLIDGHPAVWRRYGPWAACGISELRATNGQWEIVRLNDQQHLQTGR